MSRQDIQRHGDQDLAVAASGAKEDRLQSVINAALDAFIAIDQRGVIIKWNRQAGATFGWSREEAVGRSLAETIIPSQHRDARERRLTHSLATGEGTVLNQRIELSALQVEAILFPSHELGEESPPVTVVTDNGRVLTGMMAAGPRATVVVVQNDGRVPSLPRTSVEEIRPSRVFNMPENPPGPLSLRGIRDLFAFLVAGESETQPSVPHDPQPKHDPE